MSDRSPVARRVASARLSDSQTEFGQIAGDNDRESSLPEVIAWVSGVRGTKRC